jgi:hypothetical protein
VICLFQCEYCRETVSGETASPRCGACGTIHRLKTGGDSFEIVSSPTRIYSLAAFFAVIAGIIGLESGQGLRWAGLTLMAAGFAGHYWISLRTAVVSMPVPGAKRSWTVYRALSPTTFQIACILYGALVAGIVLIGFLSL